METRNLHELTTGAMLIIFHMADSNHHNYNTMLDYVKKEIENIIASGWFSIDENKWIADDCFGAITFEDGKYPNSFKNLIHSHKDKWFEKTPITTKSLNKLKRACALLILEIDRIKKDIQNRGHEIPSPIGITIERPSGKTTMHYADTNTTDGRRVKKDKR